MTKPNDAFKKKEKSEREMSAGMHGYQIDVFPDLMLHRDSFEAHAYQF